MTRKEELLDFCNYIDDILCQYEEYFTVTSQYITGENIHYDVNNQYMIRYKPEVETKYNILSLKYTRNPNMKRVYYNIDFVDKEVLSLDVIYNVTAELDKKFMRIKQFVVPNINITIAYRIIRKRNSFLLYPGSNSGSSRKEIIL